MTGKWTKETPSVAGKYLYRENGKCSVVDVFPYQDLQQASPDGLYASPEIARGWQSKWLCPVADMPGDWCEITAFCLQDGKAMSPASAGSVDRALQPAVWAILSENGQYRLPEIADGVKVCRFYSNDRYVPLYAEEAMKRVASVEWIQVSERLPEDGTWCWVDWDGPGKPFPAMRDSRSAGGWTNTDCWEDFDREVARWMPLPEPPTGASDTERAGSTAADEIERLRAEVAVLKESAAKLHDIAASGAEPTTRRRMLDQMAMESFAEYG